MKLILLIALFSLGALIANDKGNKRSKTVIEIDTIIRQNFPDDLVGKEEELDSLDEKIIDALESWLKNQSTKDEHLKYGNFLNTAKHDFSFDSENYELIEFTNDTLEIFNIKMLIFQPISNNSESSKDEINFILKQDFFQALTLNGKCYIFKNNLCNQYDLVIEQAIGKIDNEQKKQDSIYLKKLLTLPNIR